MGSLRNRGHQKIGLSLIRNGNVRQAPLMLNNKAERKKESAPILVKARDIAAALSVSERQIGYWAEEGRIPRHPLGKKCVRYSLPDVLDALGIETSTAG